MGIVKTYRLKFKMGDNGDSGDDHNGSDEEVNYFGNLQIDTSRPHLSAE